MRTKILVIAIFLLATYAVVAGTGTTGQPVMSALVGIQEAIFSLSEEPEQIEKEWYHQHFKVQPAHNDALFTVPARRQFVLKRLYAAPYRGSTQWYLSINDTIILPGSIIKYGYQEGSYIYRHQHDFPDNCITVDANEVLNTVNDATTSLDVVVVGYFQNMP